jgi:predicted GTPase
MDYRNIKRWFVINKALNSYNKEHSRTLKHSDLALIFAIAFSSDHSIGPNIEELHKYLSSFNRGFRFDRLQERLNQFKAANLVHSAGNRPLRYSLTINGKNVLNELETRCRDTRYDK